ncbi:hypothetical protein B566_EDAN002676 [Ephemera danica]|nr:hypothetical protein B566_EDAN002676 [Ephemera danica]
MEETIKEPGVLQRISLAIVNSLEKAFYRWGYNISLRPTRYILMCIGLVVISSFGFFRFHREQQPVRLWLPRNSDFVRDTDWLMTNYGETYRFQTVIITADDVLQPHVLAKLEEIHQKIQSISAKGITWGDICFRIPALTINTERNKREAPSTYSIKRAIQKRSDMHFNENTLKNDSVVKRQLLSGNQLQLSVNMDPSVIMGDQLYCNIVNSLDRECFENSVLELWKYDFKTISTLTKDDIIRTLNNTQVSPVFGHQMNYVPLLGGINRNSSGVIVAAKAVRAVWVVHVNFSAVDYEESGNAAGTGDLINYMPTTCLVHSFGDISNDAMFQDIDKLALGIIIMFIYIQLMLSKFNWVEIRLYLGMIGMLCIGMALVVSYGLCSMLGVFFGPVHNALPFLLLGIGIDDMFVIMQSWFNLTPAESLLSLPEKIGLTMKHAGASITVTSITDFVAFAIGATTIIDHEMYRNLALAMLCVMITTFLLIANVQICLMVLICVVLTLIDVGGIMYFWGLTIDIVSCVGLVLAVGLCVDYAAHIGLAFLSTTGDRNQRAHHTVLQIGPAVMNGGLSTLLALSVLADSKAHVFISFFKIFLLVVVLGLFHGLVVLPVALSLIGPDPYQGPESRQLEQRTTTT